MPLGLLLFWLRLFFLIVAAAGILPFVAVLAKNGRRTSSACRRCSAGSAYFADSHSDGCSDCRTTLRSAVRRFSCCPGRGYSDDSGRMNRSADFIAVPRRLSLLFGVVSLSGRFCLWEFPCFCPSCGFACLARLLSFTLRPVPSIPFFCSAGFSAFLGSLKDLSNMALIESSMPVKLPALIL